MTVNLCADGKTHLDEALKHINECDQCRKEIERVVNGFPIIKMVMPDILKLIQTKGKEHGTDQ